ARGRTRKLLLRVVGVLVARRLAVAQSGAMAAFGDGAVPVAGGSAKHSAIGNPRVFRSRALSIVRGTTTAFWAVGTRRSGRGWSVYVDRRIGGLRRARNPDCCPVSVDEFPSRCAFGRVTCHDANDCRRSQTARDTRAVLEVMGILRQRSPVGH